MGQSSRSFILAAAFLATLGAPCFADPPVRKGSEAFGDFTADAPGVWRHILPTDLPRPYATSAARNSPRVVPRPDGAEPQMLPGFSATVFATGMQGPRRMQMAPNGDIFITEYNGGKLSVMRGKPGSTKAESVSVFAEGLNRPFGVAFYPAKDPKWIYVGNTDSVVRFPYRAGDLKASGPPEAVISKIPTGGHATRDLAFSPDGSKMFVSVGSASNFAEAMPKKSVEEAAAWDKVHGLGAGWGPEEGRAQVWVSTPEGKDVKPFATGIRNCVGLTVQPGTGDLWCTTNERDLLGDDLVPDYSTRVKAGQHFGWPWHYIGDHEEPRLAGERPDLKGKVATPDVLYEAHSAALQLAFYEPSKGPAAFPKEYEGEGFATLHGSWNRNSRTGYKLVRLKMKNGVPTGEYQDFFLGFVTPDANVWGRPVGVQQIQDGSLLVSDDGGNVVWRIAPTGK